MFQVELKGGEEEPPGKLDSPILLVLLAPTVEPMVLACCIAEFLTLVHANTDFQLFMTVRWAKGSRAPPHLLGHVQARMSWAGELLDQAAHNKAQVLVHPTSSPTQLTRGSLPAMGTLAVVPSVPLVLCVLPFLCKPQNRSSSTPKSQPVQSFGFIFPRSAAEPLKGICIPGVHLIPAQSQAAQRPLGEQRVAGI